MYPIIHYREICAKQRLAERALLNAKEGIFKIGLKIGQKLLGVRTIHDAVIVCQSKICHLTDRYVIVTVRRGQNLCTLFDRAHTKNGDLGLIDDRRVLCIARPHRQ